MMLQEEVTKTCHQRCTWCISKTLNKNKIKLGSRSPFPKVRITLGNRTTSKSLKRSGCGKEKCICSVKRKKKKKKKEILSPGDRLNQKGAIFPTPSDHLLNSLRLSNSSFVLLHIVLSHFQC